jgi:hypothetical protein
MPKSLPPARELKYANFDEMLADVDSLLRHGYQSHGNWTLGQACGHVADWMRFPMDGFPSPPLFMRGMFAVMRWTGMTKKMAQKILTEGFKPGLPTAPDTVPGPAFSDEEGVARLHEVVERLGRFNGPFHKSLLFGDVDRDTHRTVSLLHAAHHFSYLTPRASAEDA